ncbi:DUF4350 domain-containing protein [Patulibacter sp.]|uniref:DUF4350 domain-containing protein n=1 Tax=Patulibacter sp. TaxID=1912859 RepID=UPI00271A47AD|nr:DUF4350 domain-containing protein [Patulibacter sp.]MDO9410929.1 hypothetical protein [Patulibacter sp.]
MKGRIVAGAVGLVVLVIFVLGQLGGEDEPSVEPSGGWRSGAPSGIGGWAAVLDHEGVGLRLRDVDPSDLRLLPGTTYLFAESLLDGSSARRVAREVRRGARVVAAGSDARRLLRALGEPVPTLSGPPGTAVPATRAPETTATDRVARSGPVWATPPRDLRALLVLEARAPEDRVVAGELRVGRGRVVVIPDRGVVDNRGIVRADNAAFAVAVTGRGRVVALRPRDGASTGGLPPRAVVVVLLLALAAAAALVSHGRRLGPAVLPDEDPTPGRSGYVDALAAVLARTSDRTTATTRLRARGRTVLARRVGLAPDAGPDEVRAAGLRAGLTEADAAALAGGDDGPGRTTDLQAVGRALARLEGDTR